MLQLLLVEILEKVKEGEEIVISKKEKYMMLILRLNPTLKNYIMPEMKIFIPKVLSNQER
jgi:antitoxin (DNA-binding transcriptional repressor) of toxin-antitoxin stability system